MGHSTPSLPNKRERVSKSRSFTPAPARLSDAPHLPRGVKVWQQEKSGCGGWRAVRGPDPCWATTLPRRTVVHALACRGGGQGVGAGVGRNLGQSSAHLAGDSGVGVAGARGGGGGGGAAGGGGEAADQEGVEAEDELAVAVEEVEDALDHAGRVDALQVDLRLVLLHHNELL